MVTGKFWRMAASLEQKDQENLAQLQELDPVYGVVAANLLM
ncbi:hypothetical protein GJA_5444 [Janthinobacterium agaricidamnosum NBRC 102515 = DSM 9628]|uniref:Uncharacterized protein n=1 Tax=Janthinobacterium agaricidamnosum NBRC 102515 = DSM 9628 TaxID=1349767 RepID=W0VEC5_9BURK|nr:hypothetical protein GJA_5444 [Janthinobacterium agaricidamnosum NBRC 102515 = DSM 9628]